MNPVVLVVGIVLVVALVQAAVWIPLGRRWRRRRDEFWAAFDAGVAAGEEAVLLPRQRGVYRGATGSYPQVKGNGLLVLTDRRLLFRKATGSVVDVPTDRITGAERRPVFLGSRVAGRQHVVITTTDPAEVGFYVDDTDGWLATLTALAAR